MLKDIYRETDGGAHKTAKGKRISVRTVKAPGFGPKGIARYVLPYTVFLKLKDIGAKVLPEYREHYTEVSMTEEQAEHYRHLQSVLTSELRTALRRGDNSLLGVVLNVLLAWPDCCFREELVRHPRTRQLIAQAPALFGPEAMPKELDLVRICKANKAEGRRVLAYTTYTGTRDTSARVRSLLEREGLRAAVLRASVDTSKREDWIFEQVERGVDVVVTNPEVSSVRDSDRIIGLLDAKTAKAENGERIEKHLLLTRYDITRAERGDMLKVDDVLEILSIPLLGIIPESMDVLRASNIGAPVTLADQNTCQGLFRGRTAHCRRSASGHHPRREARLLRQDLRSEGSMNVFNFFQKKKSAPVARERLQVLLAHERVTPGADLVTVLREEILAVIAKHVEIDGDRLQIKIDRGEHVSVLEIDVEIPAKAARAA